MEFFFFFFAFPYPFITHIQHMCSWGKSQLMQLYQRCHFIAGTAHVLTQAQLLPVTPVLVLVESPREPRSRWVSVSWWYGRQIQCQTGMQHRTNQPLAQSTVLLLPIAQGRADSHGRPAEQSSPEGTHASPPVCWGPVRLTHVPSEGWGWG